LSSDSKPSRRPPLEIAAIALWGLLLLGVAIHVFLQPEKGTLYPTFKAGGVRWLAGKNLYPKVDEYIYSPFAAAFFAPLALLPDGIAGILWRVISFAAFGGAFAMWLSHPMPKDARVFGRVFPPRDIFAVAWILLMPLSAGDIYNGQANPFVIGLLMLAIVLCRRERWFLAALCIGVATYFKIYPLAIGLLLAVIHPRKFPFYLVAALLAIFGLSLILQRPGYAWPQYSFWIHSLRQDPRRTQNYFGTYRDFWLILRVLRVPITMQGWTVLQAASGGVLAVTLLLIQRRKLPGEELDFLILTLGTCWMLLFGPATESSTYVILAPSLVLAALRRNYLPRFVPENPGRGFFVCVWMAYGLLIASQMLTSWHHQSQTPYTHLIQPIATVVFTVALLVVGFTLPDGTKRGLGYNPGS
jgi:hypothetical protein